MEPGELSAQALIHARIEYMRFPGSPGPILQDVNLEFCENSVVSILGASGAGKTTFLRILAGLEKRFEGTVDFGRDLGVQMVFQDFRLFPWMTAYDNIKSGSPRHRIQKNNDEVDELVTSMGIGHIANSWPNTLSGGELARVALCRALLPDPDVLLLDEPLRNLDINTRFVVLDLLQEIKRKRPQQLIIMVTHSLEDAAILSDKVLYFGGQPVRAPIEITLDSPKPRSIGSEDTLAQLSKLNEMVNEFRER